ncbi:espin-like [Danio aesculapii]|uniref:espin-like n=1 Tax=Danio aesculapii TaxID=1142201 RepID=UPI0024C0441E|nr:espin-like [Danio aesculapii]
MDESKSDRVTPPTTPPKATPSPSASTDQQLSLSSPELLKELKQPHTLKHVPAHKGLTTVFSGKGRPVQRNAHTLHTDLENFENRSKPAQ